MRSFRRYSVASADGTVCINDRDIIFESMFGTRVWHPLFTIQFDTQIKYGIEIMSVCNRKAHMWFEYIGSPVASSTVRVDALRREDVPAGVAMLKCPVTFRYWE